MTTMRVEMRVSSSISAEMNTMAGPRGQLERAIHDFLLARDVDAARGPSRISTSDSWPARAQSHFCWLPPGVPIGRQDPARGCQACARGGP